MHLIKLFLAGSFAVAAAIRTMLAIAIDGLGASAGVWPGILAGPSGIIVETLASLILGAVIALRISATKKPKSVKP